MNLAEAIKKCSMDAFDASVPCDVVLGEVIGEDPYSVQVGKMKIPEEILYISEHLLRKVEEVNFGVYERTIVINKGISVGDTLVLIRKSGGGSYVAIGKI